ncbi:DUF2868 domain-containing protein [Desulforhopalus singaporensis]|uniref:DUF2868 domain-containing protein n=1 Tax=Desulforhopalus singaporensis TaxID=91360 RepID=A0A1H0UHH6_9BACT|nr:DUF2868 domain-containing protein [Desulforhopalus singaporensis]SDP65540.1 Protein of unknown function [Desulforhopalus singaporensis]
MAAMKSSPQYKDLINLEYFFHQDSATDIDTLRRRDRAISMALEQDGGHPVLSSPERITGWIRARAGTEFTGPDRKSPGDLFCDLLRIARIASCLKGFLAGTVAGLVFFTYKGTMPVNVFLFMVLFIAPQLALGLILLLLLIVRRVVPGLTVIPLNSFYFHTILNTIVAFFRKHWFRHLSGERRASAEHALGILTGRKRVYGSIFYWPVFTLAQLLGLSFNVGLLGVTFIKVVSSDLAFGWQSTIQLSGEAVLQLVQLLALPWSWFITGGGYPGLAEIEGSRIILKEGIYHLSTGDLVAWWPFLILSIVCYGIVLRLVFLFFGLAIANRRLKTFPFDTPQCRALLRRMKTPVVSTQATPETIQEPVAPASPETGKNRTTTPCADNMVVPQIILVADDIFGSFTQEELTATLAQHSFIGLSCHRFQTGYEDDQRLIGEISARTWQKREGLLLIMEGWMVPLVDFLSYLQQLRNVLPATTIISIGLVGRPAETIFPPVSEQDLLMWKQKVEALGDPYTDIFALTR